MKKLKFKQWYVLTFLLFFGCKKKDDGGMVYIATNPETHFYHSSVMCPGIYYQGITKFKTITFLDALKEKLTPCEYCYSRLDIDRFNMEGTYKEVFKGDDDKERSVDYFDEGLYPDEKTELRRFPD